MTRVLGPIPCINCGKSVVWERFAGAFRLIERRGKNWIRHDCAVRKAA